jgi:hypothetical protein
MGFSTFARDDCFWRRSFFGTFRKTEAALASPGKHLMVWRGSRLGLATFLNNHKDPNVPRHTMA